MAKKKTPSTLALLARLPEQLRRLIALEAANAKAEVAGQLTKLGIAVGLVFAALVLLFWTIAVLLAAAIAGLSTVLPVWAAALIIGGIGLFTLTVCVLVAFILFKRSKPVPKDTIARITASLAGFSTIKENFATMQKQPGKEGTEPGKTGVWQ